MDAALQLAAALLPVLVREIASALDEGMDEGEATRRALERMAAQPIPPSVSSEIADLFAAARR